MYLGIEIGGTKIQVGVGEGDGNLTAIWRGRVSVAEGADGIRRQILAAVPEVLADGGCNPDQVRGVGVGFGGPVDDATHSVIKSHQIQGWDGFPLAGWVRDLLGYPTVLGNDADVAGLAEVRFGAARSISPVFYITIGSGIGGGLILDGAIYRGAGRGAAEIGHLRVPALASNGICYRPLEQLASGWAIQERARTEVRHHPTSPLAAKGEQLTAADVAEAAAAGDPFAQGILSQAWEHLAEAIAQMLALLAPRRIVIGGGVSLMGERLLFEPLRRLVAERAFRVYAGQYDIVPALLGEEVVAHGALVLARDAFNA